MQTIAAMKNLNAYINKYGLESVTNDYDEIVYGTSSHIIFPNFCCASIIAKKDDDGEIMCYSVALCDWNGYFDWTVMNEYGATDGTFRCYSEDDVIEACEIIRHYQWCNNAQ